MIPTILLSVMAGLGPVGADEAKPAPLPDRWLLKYTPKDMPALPEAFAKTTWYHRFAPRVSRRGWEEWVQFAPGTDGRAGTATMTRHDAGKDNKPRLTVRTVPLAVHGRLVEYDGRLYTAAVGRWAYRQPTPADVLDLGAAVELPDNVWYQAASLTEPDGPTWVQEWRLEFSDDPRTAKEGKVKVFGFRRDVTQAAGEDFVAELRFKRTKEPHETVWSIKVLAEEGMKLPKSDLPVLAFDADRKRTSIYDYGVLNQMFPMLGEASSPPPRPSTDRGVRLMQPPQKK